MPGHLPPRTGVRPTPARRWVVGLAMATLLIAGACSARPTAAADSYGAWPTFLPTDSIQPDSLLTGTVDRPALTSQGDPVEVHTAGGSVVATVTGPQVPGQGLPDETPSTTCTWTITLTGATAPIPVAVADFTTLDQAGTVYRPALVPGSLAPAAVVAPGQTVTFELRTIMKTGEGLLRWAPSGGKILAAWDFEVETD